MKLIVKKFCNERDYYDCVDESGKWHRVDFHVDGSNAIKKYLDRENLIGKTVVVTDLIPSLELAYEVKEII